MCLICVEYYYKRMTKEEVNKALPEMIMFAKNEEERNHYKKLQSFENLEELELEQEVKQHLAKFGSSYEYRSSYKTRRS